MYVIYCPSSEICVFYRPPQVASRSPIFLCSSSAMLPTWFYPQDFVKSYFGVAGPSGFGSKTTASDIAAAYGKDQSGRVAIVTGASSGIGFETAAALASAGMTVIPTARTLPLSESTISRLLERVPSGKFVPMSVELGSLASIRRFADTFSASGMPLHLLVNNAGVAYSPRGKTEDGFETQLGVNHVGHFHLTQLLMPHLLKAAPSRVVNVSSLGQAALGYPDGMQWDDLAADKEYSSSMRYGQSKLANLLHIKVRDQRW